MEPQIDEKYIRESFKNIGMALQGLTNAVKYLQRRDRGSSDYVDLTESENKYLIIKTKTAIKKEEIASISIEDGALFLEDIFGSKNYIAVDKLDNAHEIMHYIQERQDRPDATSKDLP